MTFEVHWPGTDAAPDAARLTAAARAGVAADVATGWRLEPFVRVVAGSKDAAAPEAPGTYAVHVRPCAADCATPRVVFYADRRVDVHAALAALAGDAPAELAARVASLLGSALRAEQARLATAAAQPEADPVHAIVSARDGVRLTYSLVLGDPSGSTLDWDIEEALAGPCRQVGAASAAFWPLTVWPRRGSHARCACGRVCAPGAGAPGRLGPGARGGGLAGRAPRAADGARPRRG